MAVGTRWTTTVPPFFPCLVAVSGENFIQLIVVRENELLWYQSSHSLYPYSRIRNRYVSICYKILNDQLYPCRKPDIVSRWHAQRSLFCLASFRTKGQF